VLNGKLRLHDIEDTEARCIRIIQQSGLELGFHEREDLLAWLVETAWELSLKWDPPARNKHKNFSGWATLILKRRVIDWDRAKYRTKWQFYDRTYERPRAVLVSLDAGSDGEGRERPLHRSVPSGDPGADGFARLVRGRSSNRARYRQARNQGLLERTAA
jgi:hypothetical protein